MKAKRIYALFIVFILLMCTFFGCTKENESGNFTVEFNKESSIHPPVRIGSEGISKSILKAFTFDSLKTEADIIAQVRIGDWLGESEKPNQTFFEAEVIVSYSQNAPEKFVLIQDGNSQITDFNYPLFDAGDEVLLFLKKAENTKYELAYWIRGSSVSVFDIAKDSHGNVYALDRFGALGEKIPNAINYAKEDNLLTELRNDISQKDPFLAEYRYTYPYVFTIEDIVDNLN